MNTNHSGETKQPVLLTVDAGRYSVSAVDLAVDLAAFLQVDLRGLFIEDEDLLRVSELPFTREITFPAAQERPIDTALLQRSSRAMAARFRQYLAEAAQASQVRWSYDYVRGSSHDMNLGHGLEITYSIVGQARSRRAKRVGHRRHPKVLVVANHSPHLVNAFRVVMNRFKNEDLQITLVKADDSTETPIYKSLCGIVETAGRISVLEMPHTALPGLLSAVDNRFDYVIVSRHEPEQSLRDIFRESHCPVILVS